MAITAPRYTPYAEVEFHTADQLYAVSRGSGWDSIQPTRDLISVQTNKDMTNTVGTWQVLLTGARDPRDGMDWYDRLTQNDLVVIKLGRPPEAMATVMVGLIDEVRRTKIASDPERRVLVRGSDFGKILSRAMLRFYPGLASSDKLSDNSFYKTASGWQEMLKVFIGSDLFEGKPADMISTTIVKILFRIMNMTFKYWDKSKGMMDVHLANVLRFLLDDSPNIMPFALTMLDYEGSFWNLIERVSIKPFNELFIDTRGYMPEALPNGSPEYMTMNTKVAKSSYYSATDIKYMQDNGITQNPNFTAVFGEDQSKVILFLRNTPFDYKQWNSLYTHTVNYDELISEDIGHSDQENYNLFYATNSLSIPTADNIKMVIPPVMDQDNAKKYGLNPLEVTIEGISLEADQLSQSITSAEKLSQKLYDWYHLNNAYKTGSVTVMGRGFYKVGQRLRIKACEYNRYTGKWDDLIFYIEGVVQDYTSFDTWSTTLTLTRGQRASTTQPS